MGASARRRKAAPARCVAAEGASFPHSVARRRPGRRHGLGGRRLRHVESPLVSVWPGQPPDERNDGTPTCEGHWRGTGPDAGKRLPDERRLCPLSAGGARREVLQVAHALRRARRRGNHEHKLFHGRGGNRPLAAGCRDFDAQAGGDGFFQMVFADT